MIRLKIIDVFKGTNVNWWYREFTPLNEASREEIIAYRDKKLRKLINYSYEYVPFYKEEFKRLNVDPNEIQTKTDLFKLPVIDRNAIQNNVNKLLSTNFDKSKLIKESSSGTTGIPITYYKCGNGYSAGAAAAYVLWGMSGWKPGNPLVHIWGNALSIKRWKSPQSQLKAKLFNQLNIPSTIFDNDREIKIALEKIKRFKPHVIEGYVSSIYSLAKYINNNNISFDRCKQVFTTAENLDIHQKETIEKFLGPTSDLYGSGEVLGIALRPAYSEKFYIYEPHVIMEAVDSGVDGMKEVLLTDLDNFGMPLIRYKIGDIVDDIHEPDSEDPFQLSYFNKIIGRSTDIITLPNGKRIHPINIFGGTLFRNYKEIVRHKVIWNKEFFTFVFEVSSYIDDTMLRKELKNILDSYEVSFDIRYVKKIKPSVSGKFKYLEIVPE